MEGAEYVFLFHSKIIDIRIMSYHDIPFIPAGNESSAVLARAFDLQGRY